MATKFIFGNKKIILPGTYAETKSGVKNPSQDLDYGKIIIIDTKGGQSFGGSGIQGALKSGKDSLITLRNVREYQSHIRSGLWWLLGEPLFRPNGPGIPGVSQVYVMKAAETTPATILLNLLGGGSNGGSISIKVRDEGLVGNGITNQKSAVLPITVGGTITPGEEIVITVDEGAGSSLASIISLAVINAPSSVQSETLAAILAAINANTGSTGYSAVIQGTTIYASAPIEDGASANEYVGSITTNGTATVETSDFTGGVDADNLVYGDALKIKAGVRDPSKVIVTMYRGTFKGYDQEGLPYDGLSEENAQPLVTAISPEISTVNELLAWMKVDATFNQRYLLDTLTSVSNGSGAIDSTDLINNSGWILATGGTEVYGNQYVQQVLDAITTLDYTFVLSDRYNEDSQHAYNFTILAHLLEEARYDKFIFVGGGDNKNTRQSQTIAAARAFNNDNALVVHGSSKKSSLFSPIGEKEYPSIYTTAGVLGRTCGLPPQVPLTFKALNVNGTGDNLQEFEKEELLEAGCIFVAFDDEIGTWCVLQGVNSLQNNDFLINEDATSHDLSIMRIAAQLNKELVVNGKRQLMVTEQGPNQNSLNPTDVQVWVKRYLSKKTASPNNDNLIIRYQDVTVEVQQDGLFIGYGFKPNGPINKIFFTGTIFI